MAEGNGNRVLQIDDAWKKNPPKIAAPAVRWCRVYLPNQVSDPGHVVAKSTDINTTTLNVPIAPANGLAQGGISPMFVCVIRNAHMEDGTPIEGQLEVMNGCVIVQPMNKPDWADEE